MASSVLCLITIILSLGTSVFCDGRLYKRWKHNNNLGTAKNWENGSLPCPNDKIHFPDSSPPVFIQTNISTMEIVLPLNGELVFGDHVSISFPTEEKKTEKCPGKDVDFVSKPAQDWFSPDSWCVSDTPDGACIDPEPLMLDSELVPCNLDNVAFPRDSSFQVDLGNSETIKISTLTIADKAYSDKDFKRYLGTKEGKQQFIQGQNGGPTRIFINNEKCNDVTGCACGNDEYLKLKRICESVTTCHVGTCGAGITPAGMCCPICGAVISLEYGLGFKMARISSIIKHRYIGNDVEASGRVQFTISKLVDDMVQIVFIDDNDGITAWHVANRFKQDMEQDISSNQKYGITHITMKQSGSTNVSPLKQKADGAVSSGSVVAIVFSIVIVLLVIGLGIFCFADRSKCARITGSLTKFRLSEEKNGDLELGPSIAFTDLGARGSFGEVCGFNNPMYDSPLKNGSKPPLPIDDTIPETPLEFTESDPATLPISTITVNGHSDNSVRGFDNPLYSPGPVETVFASSLGADPYTKFNPIYSTEGLEEDSSI